MKLKRGAQQYEHHIVLLESVLDYSTRKYAISWYLI